MNRQKNRFRVQLNAASLKRSILLHEDRDKKWFPRSIERGLIEACPNEDELRGVVRVSAFN